MPNKVDEVSEKHTWSNDVSESKPVRGSGRGNYTPRRVKFPSINHRLTAQEWPKADSEAWQRACWQGGPLKRPGAASHLAPATKKIREHAYGAMLSFLTQSGNLRPDEPVETRLNEDLLSAYIQSMRCRLRAHTIHSMLHELALVFQAMCPAVSWKWIRTHRDAPTPREARASKKTVDAPDPADTRMAALRHCDTADEQSTPLRAALQYRDGMMLIILIEHAMRLKNLSEMKIGEHLIIEKSHYRIFFDTTVKNDEVIDNIVSDRAAAYLQKYLDVYRPVLLRGGDDHNFLWVNIDGNMLDYVFIGHRIRIVSTRLGFSMSPHDARYAQATTTMTDDPRNIGGAAAALAHRSTRSVNSVYNQSGSRAAQAYWMKMVKGKSGK